MPSLVWFRSDLRVNDHPALHHAAKAPDHGVIGVFAACPPQWRRHDWGFPRVDFVLRNVVALHLRLERMNIPLLWLECPTFADLPTALVAMARRHRCTALFFNDEYEVNERRRDDAVAAAFTAAGLGVHRFTDQVVFPPGEVRTGQGGFFTIFTPYRKAWLRRLEAEGDSATTVLPAPRRRSAAPCGSSKIPTFIEGFTPGPANPSVLATYWPAGEEPAKQRLASFVAKRLAAYQSDRNLPALDGTSRLSPYLATGAISIRTCLRAALEANAGRADGGSLGATTWITELVWREFYRHVLMGYPRVSMGRAFRPATEEVPWRRDPRRFAAWCEGRTGVPIVDAAMRQLAETGWMHNRLRMIAAMFLTKDLLVDWRLGEQFFMRHLVDGDLASNNGGWQWAASTGTDAAPYFRIFNPISQSRRFDPYGEFICRYLPELRGLNHRAIHDPSCLRPSQRNALDYPPPICNHAAARQQVIHWFKGLSRSPTRPG